MDIDSNVDKDEDPIDDRSDLDLEDMYADVNDIDPVLEVSEDELPVPSRRKGKQAAKVEDIDD